MLESNFLLINDYDIVFKNGKAPTKGTTIWRKIRSTVYEKCKEQGLTNDQWIENAKSIYISKYIAEHGGVIETIQNFCFWTKNTNVNKEMIVGRLDGNDNYIYHIVEPEGVVKHIKNQAKSSKQKQKNITNDTSNNKQDEHTLTGNTNDDPTEYNTIGIPHEIEFDSTSGNSKKRAYDKLEKQPWQKLLSKFLRNQFPSRNDFLTGTRKWIFKEYDDWMDSVTEIDRFLILVAPAGFGKTQIAHQIVLKNRNDTVIGWHFFEHNSKRRRDAQIMLLSLIYQLAERFPPYGSYLNKIITETDLTKDALMSEYNIKDIFDELLKKPLQEVNNFALKNYVVVLDAFDESEKDSKNELVECIKNQFDQLPSWLKIFITTRPEYPMMKKLQHFKVIDIKPSTQNDNNENNTIQKSINDENNKDIYTYFEELLKKEKSKLPNDVNINDVISSLVEKSGGLFIIAHFLADEIKKGVTLDRIEELPNNIKDTFDIHFQERIFPGMGPRQRIKSIEWKILQLIVVAKQPMTVLHIQEIIKGNQVEIGERIYECEVGEALNKLSLFLNLTSKGTSKNTTNIDQQQFSNISDETEVSAYHKSVVDWLTENDAQSYRKFYIETREAHELIGKYCIKYFEEKIATCIVNNNNTNYKKYTNLPTNGESHSKIATYMFQYGIQHLFEAGMLKEARQMLLNVGWILIGIQMKHPYDITKDYQLLEQNDVVIHLIGHSIQLASTAIQNNKKDWKQLPSQLIGRLYNSIQKRYTTKDQICIQLINFCNRLKEFSYNFSWWCPIGKAFHQAETPCLKVFRRHRLPISFVSFNQDATLVVSCDQSLGDDTISNERTLIWNASTDKIVKTFSISGRVLTGSWYDDGFKLVSYCYKSMEMTVWNVTKDPEDLEPINLKSGYLGIELSSINYQYLWDLKVVISPNQTLIAIVGDKVDNIKIWNIESNRIEFIGKADQQSKWNDITWSPDSTRVATYSKRFDYVRFWNVDINEPKIEFDYDIPIDDDGGSKEYGLCHIDWSTTDPRVAVSHGNTIFIINTEKSSRQIVGRFKTNKFRYLLWSPVETKIAVVSLGTIAIWNINDSNCKPMWMEDMDCLVYSLSWSKDSTKIISGSMGQSICIYSTKGITTTTKLQNQIPPNHAIDEAYDFSKKDVATNNDSWHSFEPNEVDWKDLISEQRIKSIKEDQRISNELVWFEYNIDKMLVVHLTENNTKDDKKQYIHAEFWDPKSGICLGNNDYEFNKDDSFIEENTTTTKSKCAIIVFSDSFNSFCYNNEIARRNEVIRVDFPDTKWSSNEQFAVGVTSNMQNLYFFELI